MKVANSAIRHPITTLMVFIALFMVGMFSLSRLELELFPDISMPTVAIFTRYRGVGPYEVESGVSKPIEEALSSLNGVEKISSTSSEGVSVVMLNFSWSKNLDNIVSEVREQLTQIEDYLPEGVERPGIFKFNPQLLPTMVLNVYARASGIDIRRLAEEEISPFLEKVEGVAQAEVYGGAKTAVICRLNLDDVGKLQIPITQIMQAFQGENIDLPGGSLTIEDRYVIIRTIGEFSSIEDIGLVLIGYKDRVPVFLKDISEISLDRLEQEQFVRAGGAEGILISIQRQPGYNTVQVNEQVLANLEKLKGRLPESIRIQVRSDQAVSVKQSIGGVATAAWQGGLLAIIVLLFFLRNIRSTLIVSVVIPVSVIATFSLMDFAGLSLNMISLMGITLGVGMFVDNSIVVLESSYRKQLAGLSSADAAREGAAEVGKPIIASTLTTVAVFLPMVFVEGMAGLIFDDLALTISFALIVSLAVALSLIPLLCAKLLKVDRSAFSNSGNGQGEKREEYEVSLADVQVHTGNRFADGISTAIQRGLQALDEAYEQVVRWALDHSIAVIASAVLLFLLSVGSILLLGMEFLPESDEGEFSVYLETRIGASFEATTRKVMQMEQMVIDTYGDDLDVLSSQIGRAGSMVDAGNVGSNLATMTIKLVDKKFRDESIWALMKKIDLRFSNELLDVKYTMNIEGMASLVSSVSGGSDPLVIELSGDDLDELYDYSKRIETAMAAIDGTRNVRVSHNTGKPELQFRIKREDALSLGLSPFEIAATVRTAYKGATVTEKSERGFLATTISSAASTAWSEVISNCSAEALV